MYPLPRGGGLGRGQENQRFSDAFNARSLIIKAVYKYRLIFRIGIRIQWIPAYAGMTNLNIFHQRRNALQRPQPESMMQF